MLAAQRSGAWAELETELRDGLACVAHAAATGAPVTSRELDDADIDREDVEEFLDDLVERRLAYREDDRYLSLALPASK